MEGYSVTEAASVLGVPTERVWELLARGVLSGAPEGETGMRVYLQPRPAPAPVEPHGPNGNGGTREPERELSPFRELLTEFRNLTERYGQALLALGEARGEVAALRSRVDLLEARMDLRLPMGPPQPAAWSSSPTPLPVERAIMPAAPVEAPVDAPVEAAPVTESSEEVEATDEEERRARARGPRRATESFAEALARADDPSPPELPGAIDAAAALAALRQQSEGGSDIGLPRDVAGADEIPVAEAVDPVRVESEPVDEAPEIVEQGHPTFEPAEEPIPLEAAASEPEPEPEPEPEVVASVDADAAPAAHADTETDAEVGTEAEAEPAIARTDSDVAAERPESEPEPAAEAPEPATEPGHETEQEFEPEQAPVAQEEPGTAEVEPIAWDAERYTTDIEEPDWFAAEIGGPVHATPEIDETEPEPEPPREQVEWPEMVDTTDAGPPAESAEPTDAGPSAESAEPVEADGADEMEVAPSGTQHQETASEATSPSGIARRFPGADDLEAAIASLRAAGRSAEPPPSDEIPEADSVGEETFGEWPPRSAFTRPPTTTGAATRGPASRAYRRLRRIFPG